MSSINISPEIPYNEIAEKLNLSDDDVLLISSDVSKLATQCKNQGIAFNANIFIESFQKVLHNGTLVIPAYTDNLKDGDTFDYTKSKPTTGALSNKVMRRKDFIRSEEPLHSVFAWGKYQNEIIDLKPKSTFGKDGLFYFLHQKKAKMLIIDVHLQNSFTFVHFVEQERNVNYRKAYYLTLNYIKKDGDLINRKIEFHTKKQGIETDLFALQDELQKNNTSQVINYGDINMQLIDLSQAYNSINKFIDEGKKLYHFSLKTFLKQAIKLIMGHKKPIF